MFSSLVKIAVGASLFQVGKGLASRDAVVRINDNELSADKKEIIGAGLAIGGMVMALAGISQLIK